MTRMVANAGSVTPTRRQPRAARLRKAPTAAEVGELGVDAALLPQPAGGGEACDATAGDVDNQLGRVDPLDSTIGDNLVAVERQARDGGDAVPRSAGQAHGLVQLDKSLPCH